MSFFETELEKHVERLGISGALAAFADAGDAIGRRTLEQWRAGRVPRVMIQRGALAILSAARLVKAKRPPGKSNAASETRGPVAPTTERGKQRITEEAAIALRSFPRPPTKRVRKAP